MPQNMRKEVVEEIGEERVGNQVKKTGRWLDFWGREKLFGGRKKEVWCSFGGSHISSWGGEEKWWKRVRKGDSPYSNCKGYSKYSRQMILSNIILDTYSYGLKYDSSSCTKSREKIWRIPVSIKF